MAVGSREMVLATMGLGSCVAVAIDDPVRAIGGLAHIFLPKPSPYSKERPPPARYVDTALPLLVERVVAKGAERSRLRARLVGGAVMFPELLTHEMLGLGPRNSAAARELLEELRIPVKGEDIGGNHGRSVFLHLADSRLIVRSARLPELVL